MQFDKKQKKKIETGNRTENRTQTGNRKPAATRASTTSSI